MRCYVLLVILSSMCASVVAQQEFIIHGQEVVDIRNWPWQGSLHNTWGGDFVCGCTLIGKEWAVTAASCVPSPPYYVRFGSTDRDSGTRRHVKEIIIAENYTIVDGYPYEDIALMRIDPLVLSDTIDTVRLASNEQVNTADCYITGWGYTFNSTGNDTAGNDTIGNRTTAGNDTDRTFPQYLNQGKVRIESNTMCEWYNNGLMQDNQVCTGPSWASVPQSTCQGDEGGPLVCSANGSYLLVGISSWQSADCMTYSVYTRVSSFLWWIGEVTGWEVADVAPVKLPSGDFMWH